VLTQGKKRRKKLYYVMKEDSKESARTLRVTSRAEVGKKRCDSGSGSL